MQDPSLGVSDSRELSERGQEGMAREFGPMCSAGSALLGKV